MLKLEDSEGTEWRADREGIGRGVVVRTEGERHLVVSGNDFDRFRSRMDITDSSLMKMSSSSSCAAKEDCQFEVRAAFETG